MSVLNSQVRGQLFVECAGTKTEGDEAVERDDAECMKG